MEIDGRMLRYHQMDSRICLLCCKFKSYRHGANIIDLGKRTRSPAHGPRRYVTKRTKRAAGPLGRDAFSCEDRKNRTKQQKLALWQLNRCRRRVFLLRGCRPDAVICNRMILVLGRSQAVRQWFLVPPSLVRIQAPQPIFPSLRCCRRICAYCYDSDHENT